MTESTSSFRRPRAALGTILIPMLLAACGGAADPAATTTMAAPGADTARIDAPQTKSGHTAVFRFAKYSSGAYFYTGDSYERDLIISDFKDFRYEGAAYGASGGGGGALPVYRFANTKTGGYFYTASAAERDLVISDPQYAHMRYENSSFSVTSSSTPGAVPVYRLANLVNGAYLYTRDANERAAAIALRQANGQPLWRDEGIGYHALPPPPVPVKIMALGASNTEGQPSGGVEGEHRSYRGALQQRLAAGGHSFDFIGSRSLTPACCGTDPHHEGYSGAYIGPGGSDNNLWDRLPAIFGSAISPDVIVLVFGWNSVANEGVAAAAKYEALVNRLRELRPNAHIVLSTLHPQFGMTEAQSESNVAGYREFNAKVRALANASGGDRLHLADVAKIAFAGSDYQDQYLHWTQSGADKVAQRVYETMIAAGLLAGT